MKAKRYLRKSLAMLLSAVMALSLLAIPAVHAEANTSDPPYGGGGTSPGGSGGGPAGPGGPGWHDPLAGRRTISVAFDGNGEHRYGLKSHGWWGEFNMGFLAEEEGYYGIRGGVAFRVEDPELYSAYNTETGEYELNILKNAVVTVGVYDYGRGTHETNPGVISLAIATPDRWVNSDYTDGHDLIYGGPPFGHLVGRLGFDDDPGYRIAEFPAADILFGTLYQWSLDAIGETAINFDVAYERNAIITFVSIEFDWGYGTPAADKSALQEAIALASGYDESGYTADSWAVLAEALADAQAVMADDNATQDMVDDAADALREAISGLEFANSDYDLSKSGSVGLVDLAIIALAAGIHNGDARWNETIALDSNGGAITPAMCDFNGDGVVDILDIMELYLFMSGRT